MHCHDFSQREEEISSAIYTNELRVAPVWLWNAQPRLRAYFERSIHLFALAADSPGSRIRCIKWNYRDCSRLWISNSNSKQTDQITPLKKPLDLRAFSRNFKFSFLIFAGAYYLVLTPFRMISNARKQSLSMALRTREPFWKTRLTSQPVITKRRHVSKANKRREFPLQLFLIEWEINLVVVKGREDENWKTNHATFQTLKREILY